MGKTDLTKTLVTAAAVMGHDMRVTEAEAMARMLSAHALADVESALRRCMRELKSRLSLAAILERLPGQHPGPEEAWALCPRGEDKTVVWTDAIAQAYGAAAPLLAEGDPIGARMAFREAYGACVAEAPPGLPTWTVSLGHDVAGREGPIRRAAAQGRLPAERVAGLLAAPASPRPPVKPQVRAAYHQAAELDLYDAPGVVPPQAVKDLLADLKRKAQLKAG